MESKRENGYYWVIYKEGGKPVVCEYEDGYWFFTGVQTKFYDTNFYQINETPIKPPTDGK